MSVFYYPQGNIAPAGEASLRHLSIVHVKYEVASDSHWEGGVWDTGQRASPPFREQNSHPTRAGSTWTKSYLRKQKKTKTRKPPPQWEELWGSPHIYLLNVLPRMPLSMNMVKSE